MPREPPVTSATLPASGLAFAAWKSLEASGLDMISSLSVM